MPHANLNRCVHAHAGFGLFSGRRTKKWAVRPINTPKEKSVEEKLPPTAKTKLVCVSGGEEPKKWYIPYTWSTLSLALSSWYLAERETTDCLIGEAEHMENKAPRTARSDTQIPSPQQTPPPAARPCGRPQPGTSAPFRCWLRAREPGNDNDDDNDNGTVNNSQ